MTQPDCSTSCLTRFSLLAYNSYGLFVCIILPAIIQYLMFWVLAPYRQLVEQGKVELDAPVDIFLTELADVKLIDGTTPKRKITLRMLVSLSIFVTYTLENSLKLNE